MAKFSFSGDIDTTGSRTVYDETGASISLGEEQQLGRTGGGGSVYKLGTDSNLCIKLFKPQDLAVNGKRKTILNTLAAQTKMNYLKSDRRFCWPLGEVYDDTKAVIGYGMRRIPAGYKTFKSLFFGPKMISKNFPGWGRRELATVAKNFVDAVNDLSRYSVFVADFNPENFMVNKDCEVMFLDCDSYSFYEQNGTAHISDMYFEENAAPEILNGGKFTRPEQAEERARFSAAVIAFQLMMNGMNPFSFAGTAMDGSVIGTVRENIIAGKCPLGCGSGCRMDDAHHALWSWLTSSLQVAFKNTFRTGHSQPASRTPLSVLSKELGKFVFECGRLPGRNDLVPVGEMPRENVAQHQGMQNSMSHAFANPGMSRPMRPLQRTSWGQNGYSQYGGYPQRPPMSRRNGNLNNSNYRKFGNGSNNGYYSYN